MLILLFKIFIEFILESPTFVGGSRNHCEAIQPGKTRIYDNRYMVFVWELVSYWPVFLHFSFEACIFFTFQFPMFFLFLGWFFLSWSLCSIVVKMTMYLCLEYGRIGLNWKTITNHYSLVSAMKKIKSLKSDFCSF